MNRLTIEQFANGIASAVVTFSDTGETHTLETKPNSRNHFFRRFTDGQFDIQFRLDWGDLDPDGRPCLDADYFDPATGEKLSLKGLRKQSHHTNALPGDGRSYEWEFKGFTRSFSVIVSWLSEITEHAHASDSCSAEVIRVSDMKTDKG